MSYLATFACLIGSSFLFCFSPIRAESEYSDWKVELHQIDEEIKSSEDLRDRYLAGARRAEDQGMRWQFSQDQKQEAKRAFERADTQKQAAQMLQNRIDALKARKARILEEHPEAYDFEEPS